MQKTIIGTPSKLKVGVRLGYSAKWKEYVILFWWIGKGIGRIGFYYRKPEYPDTLIMNRSLLIDWQWTKDED